MISDDDLRKALDRIARSADGEFLYRYLQLKVLCGVVDFVDLPVGWDASSALLRDNGRRSLAAELMGLMTRGIDERGGSTEPGSTSVTERAVVFVAPQPRAVGPVSRGAGRRVTADIPDPGSGE
jgi:hypothetical protein